MGSLKSCGIEGDTLSPKSHLVRPQLRSWADWKRLCPLLSLPIPKPEYKLRGDAEFGSDSGAEFGVFGVKGVIGVLRESGVTGCEHAAKLPEG